MPEYKKDPNELGVLWEHESARGTYMTGTIGEQKVVVFKNGNKKSEKQPDWRILKSKPKDTASNEDPF